MLLKAINQSNICDYFSFPGEIQVDQSKNVGEEKLDAGRNEYKNNLSLCIDKTRLVGWIWFYGISTIVGYLMPNPFYTYKQFYFKQFSLV